MPNISAFDAGKRQKNASKAFSKRQPAIPKTRTSSGVGCFLVGGWKSPVQSHWARFADVESGGRSSALRDSSNNQQRSCSEPKTGLHVQGICRGSVLTVLPPHLEGINRKYLGTVNQNSSHFGAWKNSAPRGEARRAPGSSGPKSAGFLIQRSFPLAMVSQRDFQTRSFGWSSAFESRSRASNSKEVSTRTNDASINRRGGRKIHFDFRHSGKAHFAACNLRRLRPGEILAPRWRSIDGHRISVLQRVYKRVFNTPKNGKTREGAISDGTRALLTEWASLAEDPSPDG